MKFASLPLILFFLMLSIPAPSPAADLQQEILGVKWNSRSSDISGLSELRQKDGIGYFIRPGIAHTLFDTEVRDVVYGFYSDRFFAVYINIVEAPLFSRLKNDLAVRFGEPKIVQTVKNEQTVYTWKTAKVKIKLKSLKEGMKLAFYYLPLSTEVNEARVEETSEKSFRLFPLDKSRKPEILPSIPLFNF